VVFGDRLAVRPLRTVTSFGEVAEFAGLFLLVQNAMIFDAVYRRRRRPSDEPDYKEARPVSWNVAE